ncbi:MAG: patatin family protein [Eubacterium sp.]|nr:patatin family protein [Eubacterium sp.]
MYSCGLVLEGGGSRGIYTSGVLDAFIEKGIEFPYVIGVSMGSCNAASFIGKCKRRQHDIIINYVNDKRYMSLESLIKNGEYMGSEWIFGELTYNIRPLDYDTFESSGTVMCCVAVNALTGKPEYFYPKSLREWGCAEVRASCSMPGITKGFKIGKDLYFDGGLIDSIPLKRALEDGCEKAVVIQTQYSDYSKSPMNKNFKKLFKKYPMIGEAILNRHNLYNEQLSYVKNMADEGRAFIIQPLTDLDCTPTEKSVAKLESIYRLGYTQGLKIADKVKDYIKS